MVRRRTSVTWHARPQTHCGTFFSLPNLSEKQRNRYSVTITVLPQRFPLLESRLVTVVDYLVVDYSPVPLVKRAPHCKFGHWRSPVWRRVTLLPAKGACVMSCEDATQARRVHY